MAQNRLANQCQNLNWSHAPVDAIKINCNTHTEIRLINKDDSYNLFKLLEVNRTIRCFIYKKKVYVLALFTCTQTNAMHSIFPFFDRVYRMIWGGVNDLTANICRLWIFFSFWFIKTGMFSGELLSEKNTDFICFNHTHTHKSTHAHFTFTLDINILDS